MISLEKYSISERVQILAERFHITQNVVHKVINAYLSYCKEVLINGRQLEYFGLVSLIPDKVNDTFITTLAYDCSIIADDIKLPQYTVYTIVNEYLQSLREDVLEGRDAEIRGLVVLKPIYNEDNVVIGVHANTSTMLKQYIEENETEITSVRAHTHKFLKNDLKRAQNAKN